MSILVIAFVSLGAAGLIAGTDVAFKFRWIRRQPVEDKLLRRVSKYVADGAMAFLTREYRMLIPFLLIAAAFLVVANKGALRLQAAAFIIGGITSALAGYIGMKIATSANARTTHAAAQGLNPALRLSFAGGSVMGLSVVGLVLMGILLVLLSTTLIYGGGVGPLQSKILPILSGFSLGASSIALFARVGGGIFTKAADVGADLVGKVEAGIPEDDHRNPATIADNVGDNVGDVAGMGADLFESFAGSIIGTMFLGMAVGVGETSKMRLMVLPLLLAVAGLVASIIGIRFVRVRERSTPQRALTVGTIVSVLIAAILAFFVCRFLIGSVGDAYMGYSLKISFCSGIRDGFRHAIGFCY